MDELTGFQPCHLRHHLEQEGIRGDVERYAQETIGTALVHLQTQLSVRHVKLEEHVARRQVHVFRSATFHALTIILRESGLCLMVSTASAIWSITPPS